MKLKRVIAGFFGIALTVFTCYASAQTKKKTPVKKNPAATVTKPTPPPPFATAPEIEDGKALIAKSDCLACHKTEDKLVGPAYIAIAEKYPQDQNTLNLLTQKIINGGNGVWGAVPMAPHPAITPAEANKMIKYILTLNTKNLPINSK
jgi:cytochrome c